MIGRTNAIDGGSSIEIPLDAPTSLAATAGNAQVELTWTDPADKYATPEGEVSETGDQLVSEWDHTVLVRKTGSQPAGPNDGTVVVSSSVRNQYQTTPYTDSGLTNDTEYFYGVFAYNKDGVASPGVFAQATPISRPASYGVFGVQWDTSNSSTALTRLTLANDPNHYVDHDITSEPVPAVGTGAGSSQFAAFSHWMAMEAYNISTGEPLYNKGDTGYSRTRYDTMQWVPEFWYKIEQSGNIIRYYVASDEQEGFEKHPGSGRYMSRYTANASNVSASGGAPRVDLTRATARTSARGKGTGWQQDDYAAWCARNLLYLVEFADFNSQAKIGQVNASASAALANGRTDSMTYHTGRAAGTNGQTAIQYRHFENLWGNIYTWVDGINFNSAQVWVSTNPNSFADDTSNGYTNIGNRASQSDFIRSMAVQSAAPWAMFPTAVGGSSSTYVPDYCYYSSGWSVLCVGGSRAGGSDAGLWCFYGAGGSSDSSAGSGLRLLWKP